MKENKLDALVTPFSYDFLDVSSVLAIGGFPGITVLAGYDHHRRPFGICFGGLKGYEPKLIEIAYSFEQATKIRKTPFGSAEATNGIEETEKNALLNLANLTLYGFEKIMLANKLDALVTPRAGATPVLAIGRYPEISVLAGFDNNGVPFGVSFGGLKGSELKLIEIAYEFEQATKVRKPPSFKP
ncbi:unnamed protein product [Camellia sinensis]